MVGSFYVGKVDKTVLEKVNTEHRVTLQVLSGLSVYHISILIGGPTVRQTRIRA